MGHGYGGGTGNPLYDLRLCFVFPPPPPPIDPPDGGDYGGGGGGGEGGGGGTTTTSISTTTPSTTTTTSTSTTTSTTSTTTSTVTTTTVTTTTPTTTTPTTTTPTTTTTTPTTTTITTTTLTTTTPTTTETTTTKPTTTTQEERFKCESTNLPGGPFNCNPDGCPDEDGPCKCSYWTRTCVSDPNGEHDTLTDCQDSSPCNECYEATSPSCECVGGVACPPEAGVTDVQGFNNQMGPSTDGYVPPLGQDTGGGAFGTRKDARTALDVSYPTNAGAPRLVIGPGFAVVWTNDLKTFMDAGETLEGHNGYIDLKVPKATYEDGAYDIVENPYTWLQDEFLDIAGWSKYFDSTNPDQRKSPILGRTFFTMWRSLNGELLSRILTRKGATLVALNAPMHGGSVFIREPSEDNDGYNAYVATGRDHSIELAFGDSFDPLKGEGSVIYGGGKIYYEGNRQFNFSEFVGGIKTRQGVYIISETKPLMMPKTSALLKVRNQQHLDTLRKFDPPFLIPAFNSKINIGSPRREWHEINPRGETKFSSHADPGFYYVASFNSPSIRNNGLIGDKRYGFDLPTFQERVEVSKDFIPYINDATLGRHIFKKISHRGVAAVLKVVEDERSDYDPHYLFDIDNNHIYQSLRADVAKVLDGLEDIGGNKLPRSFLLEAFHRMMLNNTINDFDFNYLKDYYITHIGNINYKRPFDNIRTLEPLSVGVDSRYGFTAQMLRKQRTQPTGGKVKARTLPSFINNPDVVSTIIQNIRPLDFRKYDNPDAIEKLKRWHILPEDIRLSLNFTLPNGNLVYARVKNDETLKFTIGSTTHNLSANGNYEVPITRGETTAYLPLDITNLQYAYSLNNEAKQKIFNSLQAQEGPFMDVRTTDTSAMLTASVADALPDSYVLKLDPTSIKEEFKKHEFIRTTETLFTLTTEAKIADIVNESPFPTRTYYIDINDPMLSLLEQEQKASFYFNSLTFEGFGPNLNVNLVREIPKYIRIIPTNKTKNNIFHGRSQLFTLANANEEAVRRLVFVRGIDKELYKTGLHDPIGYEVTYPYPNKNREGRASTLDTIDYSRVANPTALEPSVNYIDGIQPARTTPALNTLYDVVKKLGERFILADGLTVYDVLARLGARTYYNLFNGEVAPTVVEQIKAGNAVNMGNAATEVPWYKNTIYNNITGGGADQYMARSRLIKTRTGSTPTKYDLEVYDNYSDRSYLGRSFEELEARRVRDMESIPVSDWEPIPGPSL